MMCCLIRLTCSVESDKMRQLKKCDRTHQQVPVSFIGSPIAWTLCNFNGGLETLVDCAIAADDFSLES